MSLEEQIRQRRQQQASQIAKSMGMDDDLEKGRSLPIGTIKERSNGKFIKTADGWKYHSALGSGSSTTQSQPQQQAEKPTTPSTPKTSNTPKASEFDHLANHLNHERLAKEVKDKTEAYNAGKSANETIYSFRGSNQGSDAQNAAYAKIVQEAKAKYPIQKLPKVGSLDLKAVRFETKMMYASEDKAKKEGPADSARFNNSLRMIEQNKELQDKIQAIDDVVVDFQSRYKSTEHRDWKSASSVIDLKHGVETGPDQKYGMISVGVKIDDNQGGGVGIRFMVTPEKVILMNEDKIDEFAKRSSRALDLANEIKSKLGKGRIDGAPISSANRTKALRLLENVPPSNAVSKFQGSNIDHEAKQVNLFVDTARPARHPEDYGVSGRRAAALSSDFDSKLERQVVAPLEELGYRVSIQAKV